MSYIEWYPKFAVLHISFSVKEKNFGNCLRAIIKTVNNTKYNIEQRDLDVSLPFYTTNRRFWEDDTEEMNFQIAYNRFILGTEILNHNLNNTGKTIFTLQNLAKKIFVKENMTVIVVGNTKNITKKSIKQVLELL